MDLFKVMFAVCLSVLLFSQLVVSVPVFSEIENIDEAQLETELSQAAARLTAYLNSAQKSRRRRYIQFTIGSDYPRQYPRHGRPHHRRIHHKRRGRPSGGNQLVSQ